MAHPVLTKGFLQLSPEAAMLPGPSVKTRPPPPVPPFLLVCPWRKSGLMDRSPFVYPSDLCAHAVEVLIGENHNNCQDIL